MSVWNKRTFLEYMDGRRFFVEREKLEVQERDYRKAGRECPPYCFGFRFYDVEYQIATREDGSEVEVDHRRANVTGIYYVNGTKLTVAEVRSKYGEMAARNLESDGAEVAVETLGRLFAIKPGDMIVFPELL